MDKNFLLSVGITCILIGMLYLFIKQKMAVYDEKLVSLLSVVQTVADGVQEGNCSMRACPPAELEPTVIPEPEEDDYPRHQLLIQTLTMPPMSRPSGPNIISISDDSESEDDDDCDSLSPERNDVRRIFLKASEDDPAFAVDRIDFEKVLQIDVVPDVVPETAPELIVPEPPVEIVEEAQQKTTKPAYKIMTVKDLKALLAEVGGPPLKTKAEIVQYLETTHTPL